MSGRHFHVGHRTLQYILAVGLLFGATARGESIGDTELSIEYLQSGAKICLNGVPIVRSSGVQLFAPGWSKGYFSTGSAKPEITIKPNSITAAYRASRGVDFSVYETLWLVDPHHVEITLEGKLASDLPAQLEWNVGCINAFALHGGSYSGTDESKLTPIEPTPPKKAGDCTVVKESHSILFTNQLGKIRISTPTDAPGVSLLDGRLDPGRDWTQEIPTFWLGVPSVPVKAGKPFKYVLDMSIEPAPWGKAASPVEVSPRLVEAPDAYIPQPRPIQIIPQPKKVVWSDGKFRVSNLEKDCKFKDANWPDPEHYAIHCDANGIEIRATSERGWAYALATLRQIVQTDADGEFIHACDIDDWPSMKFRGVHILPGKDALDFHRKLIERIFAPFKLNTVVLECEYTQWESAPKLWTDISVPKDYLRQYAEFARAHYIEPIPLVQSLGHAEWMFRNGQNRDLAEDPQACWAYNATNPATYDFIEKIYDEAIDAMHPKFFHIGHDEVVDRGTYPYREESKKHSVADLFTMDVKKLDAYFRPKGIHMMLWGDMMLTKNQSSDAAANCPDEKQASQIRDSIPKDAIICDWHYQPVKPDAYKSLKIFKDENLQTIACTWYNPMNISSFSQGARDAGALGLLQTTWAGFDVDENAMQRDFNQFSAYILAAEYAWSGQAIAPSELAYQADEVFARAWNPTKRLEQKCGGKTVDLSGISNFKFDVERNDDRLDGVRFAKGDGVALNGALASESLPQSVAMKLNLKADSIAFLHATSSRAQVGEDVGTYEVTFADGSVERVSLKYGANVRALEDLATTPEAQIVAVPEKAHGLPSVGLRVFIWNNPHPEQTISNITFTTHHPYASPILFGMTILNNAEAK
jgi:hypothetical protein